MINLFMKELINIKHLSKKLSQLLKRLYNHIGNVHFVRSNVSYQWSLKNLLFKKMENRMMKKNKYSHKLTILKYQIRWLHVQYVIYFCIALNYAWIKTRDFMKNLVKENKTERIFLGRKKIRYKKEWNN